MQVGDRASTTRQFTADDLDAFESLGGGATGSIPEPLIGGLFSYLLGVQLPGLGTMYLKQETRFLRPIAREETLTATVEIIKMRPEKHLVDLATTCTGENDEPVAEGRALVYVRDVVRDD